MDEYSDEALVKKVEELEDRLRHLTLAYPITMARPGGGSSLNNSSVSR